MNKSKNFTKYKTANIPSMVCPYCDGHKFTISNYPNHGMEFWCDNCEELVRLEELKQKDIQMSIKI